MSAHIRVDRLLLDRGLAESRSRAQALVAAGKVESAGRVIAKAGEQLPVDAPLVITGRDHPWVSRGGLKLAHGLEHFGIDPREAVCLDIGASTGGFTDVLLHQGARRVYAVDVGRDQLAAKLRSDPRVISLEGVNARYLNAGQIGEAVDLLVCDASFISLTLLLPAGLELVAHGGQLLVLVKPQFELEREALGKGGVVRDPALHQRACARVRDWLSGRPGWEILGLTDSPITGPNGNREFLLAARKLGP
ncbi:TlyA family RNA methyltransferase [Aquibaculum arenosum]|uniref:TlyA family RNA methyltransferase n=1 Tax=Aquibaculum arenosum TaxID=3032591 RepID=A0ABT5YLM1_9PROT|nr:TlyA family RNA methyltransferase [Fodinicurvata sp. CAU 1616]MDF2095797.1 TlyA family RNA methyltransferase [Fodinicurvata sp. CAU 1616]